MPSTPKKAATWTAFREFVVGGGIRTTKINQKVISYSDQIDTFIGTFDVFDLEDSPLINILAQDLESSFYQGEAPGFWLGALSN